MKKINDINILVVGDLMLDEYVVGDSYCMSLEAPVPILKAEEFKVCLGGAANVANNIKAAGANPFLCGVIGKKRCGKLGHGYSATRFIDLINKSKIDDRYIVQGDCKTTTKTRVLINNQQVVRYDYENNYITNECLEKIICILDSFNYDDLDVIVVSDYNKGVISEQVMKILVQTGKKIIVDPKQKNIGFYRGVFCMTPNITEFIAMCALVAKYTSQDLLASAKELINKNELYSLIITMGSKGAFFCSNDTFEFIEGNKKEIINTIGAGDSFIAAFAIGIAIGMEPIESVKFANAAAGVVVSKKYTSTFTMQEVGDI